MGSTMKAPKIRELKEAIKSLFSRPYTLPFPKKPIDVCDGFRGKPQYFEEYCVGCGACAEVCPAGAIQVIDPEQPAVRSDLPPKRRLELRYDVCNFCGNCETHCITEKGIQLSKEYDLALFDRKLAVESVEKELVICDLCQGIVAPKDQLLWASKQLGTLAYGNPTLLLMSQRQVIPVQTGEKADSLRRPDIFKILCPHCRHEVMLKDIWG